MDTSEWITVKKGTSLKSANISTTTNKSAGKATKKDYMPKPTVSFLFTSEENLKSELKSSILFKELLGIGSPTQSLNASVQFSLLDILVSELRTTYLIDVETLVYDPVMNDDDILLTKKSQMSYETSDDLLFGKPTRSGFIIYYMPHCDKELYAKTILSNQERFGEMLIVGNCLTKYVDNHDLLHKEKNEAVEIFRTYYERLKEIPVPIFEKVFESFNDTYLVSVTPA